MSMITMDGFDARDFATRYTVSGGGNFSNVATTPFGVGFSLTAAVTGSANTAKSVPFTAAAQVFAGCAYSSTCGGLDGFLSLFGDSGATQHLTLYRNGATGALQLYRGSATGTLLATSASSLIPSGTYAYVEMSATISATVGAVEVRVNGATVITFSGNTKNGGTNSTIDTFALINTLTGSSYTVRFDDFYLCNALGTSNNTFLGPWCRVQLLAPTGAGSSTQFTPVSGTNFSNVNDFPDNTATYNSDTVSGHRDTFAMGDLIAGSTVVFAVQQAMHGRQLDGGTATIKNAQKSGATISYGSTKTLTPTMAVLLDMFDVNPATGVAWTQSDVNALEAGYEIV